MTDPTPTLRRRLFITANVLVQILTVLALAVMANWLVARHHMRFDWTKASYYQLSEKTIQVLANLKEPVQVIVYLPPRASSDSSETVLEDVRQLLEELQLAGKDKL